MVALPQISRTLSENLARLSFAKPVTHVYDPLTYAWAPHERYLERYGRGPKEVVFLGMNPGPFGMGQTGVPFGEIALVRDFLGVEAPVEAFPAAHPKRPVQGFACPRSEVSGRRLWSWVQERFGTAERFFERFFVVNYCPLMFLEESGRNRTPDKLKKAERDALLDACDTALRAVVDELQPRWVIGVGAWAQKRAHAALGDRAALHIGSILHPSPASPKANAGWAPQAEAELAAYGIALP